MEHCETCKWGLELPSIKGHICLSPDVPWRGQLAGPKFGCLCHEPKEATA